MLANKIDKRILKSALEADATPRRTLSFYRYVRIADPEAFRNMLFERLYALDCRGRIYVAHEGINAQMSVPEQAWEKFKTILDSTTELAQVPLKMAVENRDASFVKLVVKVRQKIVADGLDDSTFDASKSGTHLNARAFNEAISQGATVVDMRNHYESEVGHFKGAITPDADTFRDELPMVRELLKGREEEKILLYCTGGIRCEKASAYLRHVGFQDVNQLSGGIIEYAHQVKNEGLDNYFVGKNFVFDERLGERITDDIIAHCHQCGAPADSHKNCANEACHLLFIQCADCAAAYSNCCSADCQHIHHLPANEQIVLRKQPKTEPVRNVFKKSRTAHLALSKSNSASQ